MAIIEAIEAFLMGLGVGFEALFSGWSFYSKLSDLHDKVIAAGLGVPVIVVSAAGIIIFIIKLVTRLATK